MGQIGIWQIVIIGVVVVLLFGRGKISGVMGDVAKGINAFKKGIKEDASETAQETAQTIEQTAEETVSKVKKTTKS